MDFGDPDVGGGFGSEQPKKPRELPADLPKSLDDRRHVPTEMVRETEFYDGWQGAWAHGMLAQNRDVDHEAPGQSQFLTSPILARPLRFNELTLDDPNYDHDITKGIADSDTRLMEMLAVQAQHQGSEGLIDADAIASDEKLSEDEKKKILQKSLAMAASNGDLDQINAILNGKAKSMVDVNAADEDGTPSLVYASCFVRALLSHPCSTVISFADGSRAMRASFKLWLMLAQMWTSKTGISGMHLCGP
jgi:hypothetical protein